MSDPMDIALRSAAKRFQIRGVGVPWFTHASWARLLQLAADRATLHATFSEFERNAGRRFDALVAAGHPLERVLLDVAAVDRLAKWCRQLGRPLDGDARAEFAALILAERDRRGGSA